MPSIIQFWHPGRQITTRNQTIKRWICNSNCSAGNCSNNNSCQHFRLFLNAEGEYVDNSGKLQKTSNNQVLTFWGEWGPNTQMYPLKGSSGAGMPKYLHTPLPLSNQNLNRICLNTDPSVFDGINYNINNNKKINPPISDDHFKYFVCQQLSSKNNPTKLSMLDKGSLIIFGSKLGGQFVIDTVFVVDDYICYSPTNQKLTKNNLGIYYNYSFKMVTQPNANLRLYKGATFGNQVNGMYSFAPAKVQSNNKNHIIGHPRPFVNNNILPKGIRFSTTKNQGFSEIAKNATPKLVKAVWDAIVKDFRKQGYVEGTRFILP